MSEQVVQNEVETVVERRPSVSSKAFDEFMQSGKTATMTQAEAAEALGMLPGSFTQRLNKYREPIRVTIDKVQKGELKLPEGKTVDSLKALLPRFKSAGRGRVAGSGKRELTSVEKAIAAMVQG